MSKKETKMQDKQKKIKVVKTKKTQQRAENRAETPDAAAVDYAVTTAKLSDLIPDDKNFNKGTEFGQHLIEKSLRENGAGRSILLDKNNRIIAGNKTAENAAAIDLDDVVIVETDGTKLVAVKRTDIDLDSEQGRKMALADNATSAANLEFDDDLIAEVCAEFNFDAEDWGVDLTKELDEDEKQAVEDNFDEEKDHIEVRCKRGDIWQLGEHRLMCGDSIDLEEVKRLMGGVKADLLLTDPPYNVNYASRNTMLNNIYGGNRIETKIANDNMSTEAFLQFLIDAFKATDNVLKEGGSFYIWHSDLYRTIFQAAVESVGWGLHSNLIWVKNTFTLGRQDYQWKHEPCLYGWKKGAGHNWYGGRDKDTILNFAKPQKSELHPTMKPLPLFSALITNSSQKNDNILDIFGGSGTTLIAAEQLNRKCYMIELDPHYCDVIIARWEKLTNKEAKKIA